MDFTLEIYKSLITAIQFQHYHFTRFEDILSNDNNLDKERKIILRHDIDLLPHNILTIAQVEHDLGL
jgi:hypothetical protein